MSDNVTPCACFFPPLERRRQRRLQSYRRERVKAEVLPRVGRHISQDLKFGLFFFFVIVVCARVVVVFERARKEKQRKERECI